MTNRRIRRVQHGACFALVGIAALFLAGCAGPGSPSPGLASPVVSDGTMTVYVREGGGTYLSVSPTRLKAMLATKDFTFVNVHVPYEGEIAGTDAFIPYDQVATRLSELPAGKEAKILVYCRSGRMSTIAAQTLVGLGYTNVWELDGGFDAWQAADFPLAQASQG
ncbi:MAG: rhodanese-like domain-containing protein [Candidatus Limnocylindrales bacterium]